MSEARATTTPGADLAILVLGMHRSGTSAIAEALSLAGLDIGPRDALMPPRLENPSFFGERLDVADLDDRLLDALGWTWDAPAPAPIETPPALDGIVADGRRLVSSLLEQGTRLFKDPRVSVLLPWWRRILLDRFVAVVAVRPPEEVAWSLSVRNGMPFELGLALWLCYHRHLAAGLDGLPVVLVDYDALTTDPDPVVRALLGELERLGVGGGLDADAATSTIHPSLRRTTQPTTHDDTLLGAIRPFAETWRTAPVRAFDRFGMPAPPLLGWEVALLDVQRRYRHAAREADAAARASDGSRTAMESATREAAEARTARAQAEERLEAMTVEAAALRIAIDEARAEADTMRAEAAAARRDAHLGHEEARAARREAEAAWQKAEAARQVADVARTDAAAARERAEHAARSASTAGDQAVAASRTVAATLGAHRARATIRRVPGGDRVRHAARRATDLLAELPVASSLHRNPLFDAEWYLEQYPDVRAAGTDPWRHYRRHGVAEGRDPNPWFRTARYLTENPDVRASGMNPLDHFLRYGAAEGRGPLTGIPDGRERPKHQDDRLGGDSDPPRRSGLDGHCGDPMQRSAKPSRRDLAGIERWLASLVPTHVLPGSTVLAVGAHAPRGVDGLSILPFGGPGHGIQPSDTALIARLEWQRSQGATAIAIPTAATRELGPVPRFVRHLERYPIVDEASGVAVLRSLREADGGRSGEGRAAATLDQTIDAIRGDVGAPLSVLDRTTDQVADRLAGVHVLHEIPGVPWPPRSVDVVLVDHGADPAASARIATRAVITLAGTPDGAPEVSLPDETATVSGVRVSVVIPHYGPLDVLRACLTALRETTGDDASLEVVVVDDATPDVDPRDREALVTAMPGARILVNDANVGFLATANRGVAEATGDLVVLLNNDTLLLPGWLPALLRTFREHPQAGAVGGRLVYPDGRLQEAGGLVFRDASAAKFGYGDADPDSPMYTFLRETDYVSGAFLATPRDLFRSLDGFDPVFGFGFYEDTDYCFRVRRAGRSVLYQPECVVVHVEGATAGTDVSKGPKRAQVVNQTVFRERWADVLQGRPDRPRTVRPEDWYAAALQMPSRGAAAA